MTLTPPLPPRTRGLAVLLTALVAFGPLSTDMYLPSLPQMVEVFGVSVATVQLTLSIFALGFSVGMLLYGPLSDRFGRRPVLLWGVALYVVASAVCTLAPDIEILIAGRFVQAIGACSGAVLGRAVVRDVYGSEGAARIMSYMASAMALAPAVAPILGGWLHAIFGWRATFAVLLGYGVVMWGWSLAMLRETNAHKDPTATDPQAIVRNFLTLLANRVFLGHTLVVSFGFAGLFSYISGSSFVIVDILGVPARHFGFTFIFVAGSFTLGAFWGGRATQRLGTARMINIGLAISLVTSAVGLVLAWTGVQTLWTVVPFVCGHFLACAMIMPNGFAGALGPFPRMAGAASSLLGFLQMGTGALAGWLLGLVYDGTTRPLMTAIFLSGLTAWLGWVVVAGSGRKPVDAG